MKLVYIILLILSCYNISFAQWKNGNYTDSNFPYVMQITEGNHITNDTITNIKIKIIVDKDINKYNHIRFDIFPNGVRPMVELSKYFNLYLKVFIPDADTLKLEMNNCYASYSRADTLIDVLKNNNNIKCELIAKKDDDEKFEFVINSEGFIDSIKKL